MQKRRSVGLALVGVVSLLIFYQLSTSRHSTVTSVRCPAGIPVTDRDAPHAKEVLSGLVEAGRQAGVALDVMLARRAFDAKVGQFYTEAAASLRGHWDGQVKEIVVKDYADFKPGPIDTELQRRLVHIRNELLDAAEQDRYECFLSVDADVVLQQDTLQKMMQSEQSVVTALYAPRWLRPDANSVIMMLSKEKVFLLFFPDLLV